MLAVNNRDSAVSMDSIIIRDLSGSAEFRQIEHVQTVAWDRDKRSLVPWEFMKIAQHSGGIVVGAFVGEKLIGYAFGIIGTIPFKDERENLPAKDRLQMYSHQLGVLPEYQSSGVGRRLKLAQRDFCLARGIDLMTWTFDPLMGRNGWLNIGRLGGVTTTFLADWYGELQHRFLLEWWLTTKTVESRIDRLSAPRPYAYFVDQDIPIANPTSFNEDGLITPPMYYHMWHHDQVLLEVPGNIKQLRKADVRLERAWRLHIKEILPTYLAHGYMVAEITRNTEDNKRRIFYVLSRQNKRGGFRPEE